MVGEEVREGGDNKVRQKYYEVVWCNVRTTCTKLRQEVSQLSTLRDGQQGSHCPHGRPQIFSSSCCSYSCLIARVYALDCMVNLNVCTERVHSSLRKGSTLSVSVVLISYSDSINKLNSAIMHYPQRSHHVCGMSTHNNAFSPSVKSTTITYVVGV